MMHRNFDPEIKKLKIKERTAEIMELKVKTSRNKNICLLQNQTKKIKKKEENKDLAPASNQNAVPGSKYQHQLLNNFV